MRLTLVSHASLLVETRGVRVLTDPWYVGTIYHDAWELCPPPVALPDFRAVDAIFLSHAHPDHLEPRTLAMIRGARGADVPIFIAKFPEDAIAPTLRGMGFTNVTEMQPDREFSPFPGVTFYSQQFRLDDSLLVVRGDETLLNINDCPLRGSVLDDLARRFKPEYVTAQFAIAQGYPYCYENLRAADFTKDDLVRRFDSFAEALKPKHMIPFASFVRFCHADNAHMNRHKVSLAELERISRARLTVLHPGDWVEGDVVHNDPANAARHEEADREERSIRSSREISADALDEVLDNFVRTLRRRVPWWVLRKFPEVAFVLTDADYGYRVSARGAWRVAQRSLADHPIQYRLKREVLYECASHSWGWEDLSIGARFKARVAPGWEKREIWFWVIPMLAGKGYLDFGKLWFLRPRPLRVLWGRRLELFDYLRSLMSGGFMTQVVRKKTSKLAPSS